MSAPAQDPCSNYDNNIDDIINSNCNNWVYLPCSKPEGASFWSDQQTLQGPRSLSRCTGASSWSDSVHERKFSKGREKVEVHQTPE